MTNKTSKTKNKRLSKGQRTNVRRLKQTARKEAILHNPKFPSKKPESAPIKQDQS